MRLLPAVIVILLIALVLGVAIKSWLFLFALLALLLLFF